MTSSTVRYARALVHGLLSLAVLVLSVNAHAGASYQAGGLTAYPVPMVGRNLLENPDFEHLDAKTGLPVGWHLSKAFSVFPEGKSSRQRLRLKDAPAFPYAESATQDIYLRRGSYRFGGWIKTDLEDSKHKGVRYSLVNGGSSQISSGRSEHRLLEVRNIFIPNDGKYKFKIESYSEPSGTAWFNDVFLKRESYPVEAFLLYPNYRGMLFDDQSQVVRLAVNVDPPGNGKFELYAVRISIVEEKTGAQFYSGEDKAQSFNISKIDCSNLIQGNAYLIRTRLVRTIDNTVIYEYPSYRIWKLPGKLRKDMAVSFDEHNRFIVRGKPTFLLGVYDSGMGYPASEAQWIKNFSENRRLFELPINLYLNYWYGQASLKAMQTMMNVLEREGIYYLQTGNAFNTSYNPNNFAIDKGSGYLRSLSEHSGLAGFYTVDEAVSSLAPAMFEQYRRLKAAKPDGITFAALLDPKGLRFWRDTADVISMDPYPLAGSEPVAGYPLSLVADWSRATREAVMDSRPFMTVLQYFKFTSKGRWPTRDEMRNMSYMAIAEGANGLMYWSLGARALAHVCKGWCDEKVGHFEDLRAVMNEIKGLEPALTSIDRPGLLLSNSNSKDIRTMVRFVDGKGYLIASNTSPVKQDVVFGWVEPVHKVHVYGENREIVPSGAAFSDSFVPFKAHVYEISTRMK